MASRPRTLTLALALALLVSGCATTRVEVRTVEVEVPVPCRAPVPERPMMPTDLLEPGTTLDSYVAAAAAEIDRREAYEALLRIALEECRR